MIGCIADDFTGASDAASFLSAGGLNTQLINGIPEENLPLENVNAVVIALKSRSVPAHHAVAQTLTAARWLKAKGAKTIYFKYCSTFDSTHKGNIGPVADALLRELHTPYTILCPALPVNGRTVRSGHLFVNGIPLDESPMKNHPLNPMWDSSIEKLMDPQSDYACYCVPAPLLESEKHGELNQLIQSASKQNKHFYLIPDYFEDHHGQLIAKIFEQLPLLTGGSGILQPLAQLYSQSLSTRPTPICNGAGGRAIILAGSCSAATREQIDVFIKEGGKACKIMPEALLAGTQNINTLWEFIDSNPCEDILLYSSASPSEVEKTQFLGAERVAFALETLMRDLAVRAVAQGIFRLIIAGGETSGAVTKGLGYSSYLMGSSVAPGVPVMQPVQNAQVRIVLKSGNFGQPDFFLKALKMTSL